MIYFYDHRALSGTVAADLLMIFFHVITEHRQGLFEHIYSWHFHNHWASTGIIGADLLMTFSWSLSICRGLLEQIYSWHFHDHWVWSGEQQPVWECDPMVCCVQVCPICASLPGGDPNHVTDDFASHLALEHRTPRDFISFAGLADCTACCWHGDCTACCWHGWLACQLLTWLTTLIVVDIDDCTACCWHRRLHCLLLT